MAWFTAVEAQFKLRRIWSEEEGFCNVTAALDKMTLKKVMNLVVVTPGIVQPYSKLKEALLASHQLTYFQRVELILAMELLGSRKPSELLVDMWEVCPSDEHNSKFFAAFFLQHLPSHIRELLTHEDHSNLRLLAAKADQLGAFGGQSNTVAAATEMSQEDLVAALPAKGKQMKGGKQNKKQPPPLPLRPQKEKEKYPTAPATLARDSAGLCHYHWSYRDRANNCSAPCSWQGNLQAGELLVPYTPAS